jgi:hypothetical protein
MSKQWISILIVGLTFGTAWAIRGQFGHEEGAAWAATIGGLSLVMVSGRKDWYSKILLIALSSAVGWGAGGMISYGKVVGYGRSLGFVNASYGLLMLFVIGSLFGLMGGGLVGLTLTSTSQKRVKWASLVSEMVAGGLISYYFLVGQLEILMTPPRSEAWAISLGAGLAMLWHMARNNYRSALRVAFFSSVGAGFGFAFGNFLQICGNVLEINFNMWNVMEYSIGFFGGISMAYAVFSSEWPEEPVQPENWENRISWLIIFALIPVIVFIQSRMYEFLTTSDTAKPELNGITTAAAILSLIAISALAVTGLTITLRSSKAFTRRDGLIFLFLCFGVYIFLSYCVTGAFAGQFHLNHHLYIVNYMVVIILLSKKHPAFFQKPGIEISGARWLLYLAFVISVILILSFVLINVHGELNGAASRFPNL